MRVLAALHRWWGVAFCLLFAMWFASGIVMHFVPFPARSAAGGSAVDPNRAIRSERDALPIAAAYARSRGLDPSRASTELISYDQWTVAGEFDYDRPLYRVAINDGAGTEIYVASANGEIVLLTTQTMRLANYFGSIAHWIYPAALRHHGKVWRALMWWLSLVATVGASIGVILGIVRLGTGAAYQGLQRWHHMFGLIFAPFILCWIFSGFLTMDDGWLASLATRCRPVSGAAHIGLPAPGVAPVVANEPDCGALPVRSCLQPYGGDAGVATAGCRWRRGAKSRVGQISFALVLRGHVADDGADNAPTRRCPGRVLRCPFCVGFLLPSCCWMA